MNEKYGLIPQIRRAAISIPLNISEGSGCNTDKEFSQFISYAYRSVNEVLTCLELSVELKLVKDRIEIEDLTNEGIELSKMIYGFFKKLKNIHAFNMFINQPPCFIAHLKKHYSDGKITQNKFF